MEKVKVLFLTSLFGKMGGAEKNIYDIVLNIDKSKFIPYVFCLKGGELINDIISKGINSKIINLNKIISIDAAKKGVEFYRFLKDKKIDIVVTYHHDADLWGGTIAMLAGVPAVISSRRDLGYQLERKHIWAYRALNRFFTRIVSVSEAVKQEVIKREWTSQWKIVTIYNGVDMRKYLLEGEDPTNKVRNSLGIKPSTKIVGMLGALRPIKGHIYLVRAVAEVRKRVKDFKVVVVGYKGEPDYFKEVEEEIKHLGVEDYFVFLGDRKDVPDVLSMFDMLVIPSISEGFSNAALEAMAAGKPLVVTDCGGNPEAVNDNVNGLIVPPCDSHSLAEAIIKLLVDESLRVKMGLAGAKKVTKLFSLKAMIDANEDLYAYFSIGKKRVEVDELIYREKRRFKKYIKLSMCHLLYYSGRTSAYKRKFAEIPKVLAYHSINKMTLMPLEIEQDPENFEKQIELLKKDFNILSLSEFLNFRKSKRGYPCNSVLLTFDDGYRDNYINAFPILKRYRLPAVMFIATGPIETGDPLFFDSLRYAVSSSCRKILDLTSFGFGRYFIDRDNVHKVSVVIKEITEVSKNMDGKKKMELISEIYERLWLDYAEFKTKRHYLSWDEIRDMADHGIDFGSHTVSHPQLSSISFEECEKELTESKRIIELRIGKAVKTLAYPYGGLNAYNELVEDSAKKTGYECAFSLTKFSTTDMFTIGRKSVDSHMSSKLSGKFCKQLFLADLINVWR